MQLQDSSSASRSKQSTMQDFSSSFRSQQSTTIKKLEQNKNFQVGSNAMFGGAVSVGTMGLGWGASTVAGIVAGGANDYTGIATKAAATATVQLTQQRLDQAAASQKLVTTVSTAAKNTYNTVTSSVKNSYNNAVNSYNNAVNSTWNAVKKLSNPFHW
jgi:hypothetical protein